MERYEILEHPSELRIRVYGKTLEELFSNAALAMSEIMSKRLGTKNREPGKMEKIKVESVDINSLLVDFLSEILAKSQINKKVYKVEKIEIDCHPERSEGSHKQQLGDFSSPSAVQNDKGAGGCSVGAELIGHPITQFDEDIKAVTYEDLEIKKVDDHWETVVVFDI